MTHYDKSSKYLIGLPTISDKFAKKLGDSCARWTVEEEDELDEQVKVATAAIRKVRLLFIRPWSMSSPER